MNRICLVFIILTIFKIETYALQSNQDTSVVVEDCLKKTKIKKGNRTRVETEFLDCFWESGVDTSIVIENCMKITRFEKQGYIMKSTQFLDCYWMDAQATGDTLLVPKKNGSWNININVVLNKDGHKQSKSGSEWVSEKVAYRLGLDSLRKEPQKIDLEFYNKILLVKNNPRVLFSIRDTTINIQAVLGKVNQIRSDFCQCGNKKMNPTTSLEWSEKLAYVAYLHAKDMYKREYFDHISPDGENPGDRIRKSGLDGIAWGGENIAEGQVDGCKAVDSWKKSPGHCKNMMNPGHSHVGVARYMDKYVMLLGSDY